MQSLTIQQLHQNPECIRGNCVLASGERIRFRILRPDDAELLGDFFTGLSDRTRGLFAPHPFTREEARKLCERIGEDPTLRFVGVASEEGTERIVAYFLLVLGINDRDRRRYAEYGIELTDESDCEVAPCVADPYQGRRLGGLMMRRILQVACRLGRTRAILLGGVQAPNKRAVRFYRKFRFRQVGSFRTEVENFDMMLDLAEVDSEMTLGNPAGASATC